MSAAAYRRGSRLLSSEADKRMPAALSHADRSDKPRRFEVWVDRNAVGLEMISEVVDVAPGEDANAICSDVLETLMSNEIDSGWQEVRP